MADTTTKSLSSVLYIYPSI